MTLPQILILSAFFGLAVYAALLISRLDIRLKIAEFLILRSDLVFFGAVLAIILGILAASYWISWSEATGPVPDRSSQFQPNAPR